MTEIPLTTGRKALWQITGHPGVKAARSPHMDVRYVDADGKSVAPTPEERLEASTKINEQLGHQGEKNGA